MDIDDNPMQNKSEWSEDAVARSVTSRARIRAQLSADIDAFLARGGRITELKGLQGSRNVGLRSVKLARNAGSSILAG